MAQAPAIQRVQPSDQNARLATHHTTSVVYKFQENSRKILGNLHVIAPDRQYISYPGLGLDDKDSHFTGRSLF
jgi:hypothetical protein